jgi:mannose-6-phosphate isomerase-like protein (cupin superfamily)
MMTLYLSALNSSFEMALQRYNLDHFTKGWFVGNFSPTLIATDAVEVAVKHYRAGEAETAHYHKVATELTLIVSGRVRMSGEEVGPGEIIKIEPGQATDFVPLTDTTTVVVKLPCVNGDKYPCAMV